MNLHRTTVPVQVHLTHQNHTALPIRTDVDQVALAVQHDVAVVSVFNLQQEEQQAVRRHAADEVVPRLKRTSKEHQSQLFRI